MSATAFKSVHIILTLEPYKLVIHEYTHFDMCQLQKKIILRHRAFILYLLSTHHFISLCL